MGTALVEGLVSFTWPTAQGGFVSWSWGLIGIFYGLALPGVSLAIRKLDRIISSCECLEQSSEQLSILWGPIPFLPLHLAVLFEPFRPTTRILADLGPPGVARKSGRAPAAHASLAVEDNLSVLGRAGEAEAILELFVRDVEAVRCRVDGDVDCVRDVACLLQLARFADICIS